MPLQEVRSAHDDFGRRSSSGQPPMLLDMRRFTFIFRRLILTSEAALFSPFIFASRVSNAHFSLQQMRAGRLRARRDVSRSWLNTLLVENKMRHNDKASGQSQFRRPRRDRPAHDFVLDKCQSAATLAAVGSFRRFFISARSALAMPAQVFPAGAGDFVEYV